MSMMLLSFLVIVTAVPVVLWRAIIGANKGRVEKAGWTNPAFLTEIEQSNSVHDRIDEVHRISSGGVRVSERNLICRNPFQEKQTQEQQAEQEKDRQAEIQKQLAQNHHDLRDSQVQEGQDQDERVQQEKSGKEKFETDSYQEDDNESYDIFVEKCWNLSGVPLNSLIVERVHYDGKTQRCVMETIVKDTTGHLYLNCYVDGQKKTFSADSRHKWLYQNHTIDSSAFVAILRGIDVKVAFAEDIFASSIEEALSLNFNRFEGSGKKYVIQYTNSRDQMSYRFISSVVRLKDKLTSRCHYRWGERRHFRLDRIKTIVDVESEEIITVKDFMNRRTGSKKETIHKNCEELSHRNHS